MSFDGKETYEESGLEETSGYKVSDAEGWDNTLGMGQAAEKIKGNILLGLLGAAICSLAGVAIWIVIYQLGYIASISGIVMTICALWGYEKFGGKLDKVGVILSFIIVVVMIYVANRLTYTIEVYKYFHKEYDLSFLDSFKALSLFLEDSEVKRSYLSDLGMGYLFCLIGSVSRFIRIFKGAKGE
ncbi:hypothetical protein acsn021_35710 [Anaerocolumna cellulosilytica]|uniref:Uncharacterized protein n=1 Tax=Anaerocolumna cellulosilytica TaxID=433286 RepID=A0A6S6R9Q2_9FIRM|nr:hypothetical protein [Anaerocolumna cellulosilytica]MBB5195469.1 hypothetical protein [Anaerocolumna cellulosilytica]BCJ96002.1 hypothetical protein acsn021_35710 [Anaerocolumna cellulosilytica]